MGPVAARGQGFAPREAEGCAPALRSPASDLPARLLALQRTAGNRAVADLVGRRMLQRSSTVRDVEQQQDDDVDSVQHLLSTGTSRLVDAEEPDPGVSTEEEMELVAPEEVAVSDAPQTMVTSPPESPFSFTSPFEVDLMPFEFTSNEPFTFTASSHSFTPSPIPPTFTFSWPEPEGGGMKRTMDRDDEQPRKRRAVGSAFSSHPFAVPLQQAIATWPARGRVQRTTFKPAKGSKPGTAFGGFGTKGGSSAKTRTKYVPHGNLTSNATTLGTGIHTHADVTAAAGATRGTAMEMKVKRWIVVKGTGTAQKVRPAGWDRFQALCGFIDKSHKCVYVQGHLLYERLGGRGNKMANLAPFTASLNKRHQNQVEKPLWEWLKAAKSKQERTVDYQVIPTYGGGGPPGTKQHAVQFFRDFVDNRSNDALKTLVKLKLVAQQDVKAVTGQPRSAAINLTAPQTAAATWDALCVEIEQEIADYVEAAFPAAITCSARLYKRSSAKSDWDKTQTLHHSLPNHP